MSARHEPDGVSALHPALCDVDKCGEPAEIRVGGIRFCTNADHIEWGMAQGLAPARHLREAIARGLGVDEEQPTVAERWQRRGNLLRYQLHQAAACLRGAERMTADLDEAYSQSLAAVALQAEDLLEQLPRRMGREQ